MKNPKIMQMAQKSYADESWLGTKSNDKSSYSQMPFNSKPKDNHLNRSF